MQAPPVQEVGTDASSKNAIAGRIESESTLAAAVESWLRWLEGRKKSERTIQAYREVSARAMRECGWTHPDDLTFESVTSWLEAHPWKGTTYNRNLSLFKSLTRHMKRLRLIGEDPLDGAERAEEDGDDGSRAATVEEARALILRAWIRDQADARCKGNRALYWLCLFSHGCRVGEPARWKRAHLALDEEVPHILWRPDNNKGRKRRVIALAPELVEQLRLHLAAIDRQRAADGLDPLGPDDPVFPVVPSPSTFGEDRDAAGIAATDYRGRGFTAHSARHYFSTVGTASGIPEKMIDFMMKHRGRVEHRYYDPPLAEQAAQVAKLPRLWPQMGHNAPPPSRPAPPRPPTPPAPSRRAGRGGKAGGSENDLTSGGEGAEDRACAPDPSDPTRSISRPGPWPHCSGAHPVQRHGPGRAVEPVGAAGQAGEAPGPDYESRNRHSPDLRDHHASGRPPGFDLSLDFAAGVCHRPYPDRAGPVAPSRAEPKCRRTARAAGRHRR